MSSGQREQNKKWPDMKLISFASGPLDMIQLADCRVIRFVFIIASSPSTC